jgi:ribonuclease E
MGKISKFGLMELSRQRLRPALSEGSHVTCPRCNGTGHIRDTESSALQVLRIIQEEAMKENTAAIHCQVPVEVVAFLLNEKRAEVIKIETRFKVHILMIPNKHLETPHYKLERLRHDDPRLDEQKLSYVMVEEASRELETDAVIGRKNEEVRARPEAAVKGITPSQPAPAASPRPIRDSKSNSSAPESSGFLGFIKKLFSSSNPPAAQEGKPNPRSDYRGRNGDRNRNRGRNRNERNQRGDSSERIEKTIEPTEAAANRPPRSEGRNRNRGERQNNQEKVEIANSAPQVVGANDESEGSGDERRRGRNRRGRGRNRGERAERHETSSSTTNSESNPGFPMGLGGRSASVPLTRIVSTFRESTGGRRPNQRRERREEIATPVIETFAASTMNLEAVTAPPLPELPRVAFTPLAEEPLKDVVQGAGMVWVGTDQSKLAEVQTQIQAESPAPRIPRVPKSPASLPTGPMVLVETGGQEKPIDKTV